MNVAARIVAVVLSAATAFIIAAHLSPRQYGAYALAAGVAGLLVIGTDLGISSASSRYVAQGRMSSSLFVRLFGVRYALAAIAAILVVLVSIVAGDHLGSVQAVLPAAAVLMLAQSLMAFLNGTLPAQRRVRLLVFITVFSSIAELVFVVLVASGSPTGTSMLLASAAGTGLTGLLGIAGLAQRLPVASPDTNVPQLRTAVRYGVTVFGITVTMAVFGQVDQFVIGAFHGAAAVAPYALAVKCMAMFVGPSTAIAGIVAPRLAKGAEHDRAVFDTWLVAMTVIFLGPAVLVATLSDELFGAINPAYVKDGMLLTALAPFLLAMSVAALPTMALTMLGQASRRARIAGATLTCNVVLDLALVPRLGAWGAVIGTSVSFGWYFVAHLRLIRRQLPLGSENRRRQLYGVVGIAMAAAGAAAILGRAIADVVGGTDHAVQALLLGGGISGAVYLLCAALIWRRLAPA